MTFVDEAAEREAAGGADQGSQRHRAAIGGVALVELNEERDLPDEIEAGRHETVGRKHQDARKGSSEDAGRSPRNADIGGRKQRSGSQHLHDRGHVERDVRPECRERPAARERTDDADDRGDRLAGAELVAAVMGIAERGEIGVVGGPIEGVANRGERAPGEQLPADAVDLGKQRKLQGGQQGAGDDERPQPEAPRRHKHQRPDREAAGNDQRDRGEHHRCRHAAAQQVRRKERPAAAHRQRVNGVMQVEQVDGVVAKEGHGFGREQGSGQPAAGGRRPIERFTPAHRTDAQP
jgi:hypothetical protein